MSLIGIITNQKNEMYIKKELLKNSISDNIIFINEKNISNMKNIKFEVIVIDKKINNKVEFRKIISGANNIILNMDIQVDIDIVNNLNLKIITYGFNSKSTFTVSSVTENSVIICLQRTILNIYDKKIEPQEYQLKNDKNIEIQAIIASKIVNILNSK